MCRIAKRAMALAALALAVPAAPAAAAEPVLEAPPVTVEERAPAGLERHVVDPRAAGTAAPDAAALVRRAPGAALAGNGPLSGQTQYRGLFGPRMNVRIDGMAMTPGGPNWMDPPLHYLPPALTESLEVTRGIAPVRAGAESIGGTIEATSRKAPFAPGPGAEAHGEVEAAGRSVDGGFSAGALASIANDRHRLHARAHADKGGDVDFGGGTIAASRHERHGAGLGYGFRHEGHELSLDWRRSETGESGNPSLPMDIKFFDTDILRAGYDGEWRGIDVDGMVYYSDVGHRMTNFDLRPFPAMPRFADASARTFGYEATATFDAGGGELSVGVDGHAAAHDMTIFDPTNAAFFVTQFNDAARERHGAFAEWTRTFGSGWEAELGVRYTRVAADADRVDALPAQMMPPPRRLRDAFNAAGRARTDDNLDWVVKLRRRVSAEMEVEIGVARKTRSPSHIERYLWLPLEVSAGLADGNNYVGDIGLDPEVARQVELGLDWSGGRFWFAPRAFYHRVDDFIQGVPASDPDVVAVSTMNGDSTPLRFANVDAELYGFDAEMGANLSAHWRTDAVLSYVRGKRRDVDDSLYRVAPPNARLGLTHERDAWSATLEGVFVAPSDNVSATIVKNEPTTTNEGTAGYVLVNLSAQWAPVDGLELAAGIENLFDRDHADHLAGFNRVAGSDVPLGVRLPGPGRNLFARARLRW